MKIIKQMLLLALATGLGLVLAGCQPSDPSSPKVASLTAIALAPGSATLPVGAMQSLVVMATYSDGSTRDVSFTSTFASSNRCVATVSATGLVTAVASGTATITATNSGKTVTSTVTVSGAGGGPQLCWASNYSQIDAQQWKSAEGGDAGTYIDTDVTTQYWWNGVAPGDATPNFYFGYGINSNAKPWGFGAYVSAPGNKAADVSGYNSLNIAVWGNPELMNTHPTLTVLLKGPDVGGCNAELKSTIAVTAAGVQSYTLALGRFTLDTPCGYTSAAQALAAGILEIHVQVLGANIQYVTVAPGTVSDYANGLNIGPISFKNVTAPVTAAPTPPARNASDVLSVYSDAYAQIAGVNLNPNWGQSTVVTEELIAGNKTQKYATLNYQGIDWASWPIDVSAMTSLHVDLWTADVNNVKVSVISDGKENAVTLSPTAFGWNSFDIDMAQYTAADKTAVIQLKFEGSPNGGTLYLDNIYFWKPAAGSGCGTTAPTCAPTTVIPSGSVIIYSDGATVPNFNPHPDWSQSPPVGFSEPTIAGNKSLQYVWPGPGGLYEGLDWTANPVDVSAKGKLHIDFWTPDLTSVKVSLISANPNGESAVTVPLTAGSWNSVDIDLSDYSVPNPKAIIQIKLEPNSAGTLYVDNIYFWGTAASGGGFTSITFDDPAITYTLTGFGGADDSTKVADPTNAANQVAKVVKSATAELWAGTTVSTGPNNTVGTIPFTAANTKMTVRVWSPDAGIPVRLKVEDAADPTHSAETEATTTVAGGWQTLTFDFANPAAGTAALNLSYTYNKVSIFFNFGTTGAVAGAKTYYFDDVTFN